MDAVKFIEEHRRMYKVTGKHLPTLAEGIPAEDVVKEVEEWAAAHPRKTEYHKVADPLLRAQADGRLVVLPFTRGRTLLCEENIDSPRLMKDVELAIRYCSSCGIVFYMGYNAFCDLVKHGRITAVSEETEKALEAMK